MNEKISIWFGWNIKLAAEVQPVGDAKGLVESWLLTGGQFHRLITTRVQLPVPVILVGKNSWREFSKVCSDYRQS